MDRISIWHRGHLGPEPPPENSRVVELLPLVIQLQPPAADLPAQPAHELVAKSPTQRDVIDQ